MELEDTVGRVFWGVEAMILYFERFFTPQKRSTKIKYSKFIFQNTLKPFIYYEIKYLDIFMTKDKENFTEFSSVLLYKAFCKNSV